MSGRRSGATSSTSGCPRPRLRAVGDGGPSRSRSTVRRPCESTSRSRRRPGRRRAAARGDRLDVVAANRSRRVAARAVALTGPHGGVCDRPSHGPGPVRAQRVVAVRAGVERKAAGGVRGARTSGGVVPLHHGGTRRRRRAGRFWRGDVVLRGQGDPTLSSADLDALAATVRARGITRITGWIRADESAFDTRRGGPGWKRGWVGIESPPLSALAVDRASGWPSKSPPLLAATAFRAGAARERCLGGQRCPAGPYARRGAWRSPPTGR